MCLVLFTHASTLQQSPPTFKPPFGLRTLAADPLGAARPGLGAFLDQVYSGGQTEVAVVLILPGEAAAVGECRCNELIDQEESQDSAEDCR